MWATYGLCDESPAPSAEAEGCASLRAEIAARRTRWRTAERLKVREAELLESVARVRLVLEASQEEVGRLNAAVTAVQFSNARTVNSVKAAICREQDVSAILDAVRIFQKLGSGDGSIGPWFDQVSPSILSLFLS